MRCLAITCDFRDRRHSATPPRLLREQRPYSPEHVRQIHSYPAPLGWIPFLNSFTCRSELRPDLGRSTLKKSKGLGVIRPLREMNFFEADKKPAATMNSSVRSLALVVEDDQF